MIDTELNQPLRVHTDGDAGPYLMVPVAQLPAVEGILHQNGIVFTVSDDAIQLDGRPAIAIVDFGRREDWQRIQRVLDAA